MMTNGIVPGWLRRNAYRSWLLTHNPPRQCAKRSPARGIILGLLLGLGFCTIIGLVVWLRS